MGAEFSIGRHAVGNGTRCFIIGEVAQAHDGSLGSAHAFVDAIARAGADAVKFQTHIAEAESTPDEPWRVRFSPQDETRFDYWRRMEFAEAQWAALKRHAEEKGLVFLSSPFSTRAVQLLERLDIPAWKIASGELSDPFVLDDIAHTGKPVLISSGMSPMSETDRVVEHFRGRGCPVAVFQCTTAYPTPPEKIGLNLLAEFRARYGCPVGLSDHSGTIFAGLAAAALQADLLEVHVTLSRDMFGPDVAASVTTDELAQLVDGVRFIERARHNPVDKDAVSAGFEQLRQAFTKSLRAARDLAAGTRLQRSDLVAKKPGTGIPAYQVDDIVGKVLVRPVPSGGRIRREDLEPGA